jgi:serine/threonine protein kinase
MTTVELAKGGVVDDRFTLIEELGRGGAGVVWAASDQLLLGQRVALKILHEHHRENENALERLEREAQLLARMDHPNIARPLAVRVRGDGPAYLATEFVDGQTLARAIRTRSREGQPFSAEELRSIFEDVCSAIDHAHKKSIVHRDLKPENILLQQRGWRSFAKVVDFGVAKFLEMDLAASTTIGRRIGTIMYMSPEQTLGAPSTEKTDIFALGIMLFETCTLRRPWAWDDDGRARPAHEGPFPLNGVLLDEVLARIGRAPRPQPSAYRPELGAALDEVIARATAIDPAERHESVLDLMREFRAAWGDAQAPIDRTEPVSLAPDPEVVLDEKSVPIANVVERTASGAQPYPPPDPAPIVERTASGVTDPEEMAPTDPQWNDRVRTAYAAPRAHDPGLGLEPDRREGEPASDARGSGAYDRTSVTAEARDSNRAGANDLGSGLGLVHALDRLRNSGALVVAAGLAAIAAISIVAVIALRDPSGARAPRNADPILVPQRIPQVAASEPIKTPDRDPRVAPSAAVPRSPPPIAAGELTRERARAPARARSEDAVANPIAQALARVDGIAARARSQPDEVAVLLELGRAIDATVPLISDPAERARVRDLATSSTDVGDREGLFEAVHDLHRALDGAAR